MINISEFFIKKVITTTLLVITVVLFGIFAYLNLPVSDLPSIEYPVITINASYPGANPEIMAAKVAMPLEEQCMKIPGLKNVISTSSDGYTQVILNFEANESVDLLAPDVQAAIQRAKRNMPTLPEDPVFSKNNPSNFPIMEYVFYSETLNKKALFDLINRRVVQPLQLIEGVSNVGIYGVSYAIRIKLDPNKMGASHITISDVRDAISNANLMMPGGGLWCKYSNV
jgi:HAE1 family hydrophobic/amphiphilic exporter-1